eukprot:8586033-Pyramimonas_sp.AAC.1
MFSGRVRQRLFLIGLGVRDLNCLSRRCPCTPGLRDRAGRRHLGGLGRPALDAAAGCSARGLPFQ